MAGIGFALRKLARRDDILGVLQGHAHSAFITSGPWMFTILALAGINVMGGELLTLEELTVFRVVVIYNFCFSVVLTGPLLLVATRYLADCIYVRKVDGAPGMLLAALGIGYGLSLVTAGPFYVFASTLPPGLVAAAVTNFMITSGIWVVSVFLSALKDYTTVTMSFAAGMATGLIGSIALGAYLGTLGMIMGFTLGLAVIQFTLIARVFAEYPYRVAKLFAFLSYFPRYWDLALIGLVANLAVWADKWIMWSVPEREVVAGALTIYSAYDSAMFVAYLTVMPALTVFTVNIETRFFEHYQNFYKDIQGHATWAQIARNQKLIITALLESSRNLIILQGAICAVAIFMAPGLVDFLGLHYKQIGMFRFGVLGAFFQVLFLFCTVVLAYFDLRGANLAVQCFYLVCNVVLTWLFSGQGFAWYGYGYFLSSLLAFTLAYLVVASSIRRLPYLAFVANNPSVQ